MLPRISVPDTSQIIIFSSSSSCWKQSNSDPYYDNTRFGVYKFSLIVVPPPCHLRTLNKRWNLSQRTSKLHIFTSILYQRVVATELLTSSQYYSPSPVHPPYYTDQPLKIFPFYLQNNFWKIFHCQAVRYVECYNERRAPLDHYILWRERVRVSENKIFGCRSLSTTQVYYPWLLVSDWFVVVELFACVVFEGCVESAAQVLCVTKNCEI